MGRISRVGVIMGSQSDWSTMKTGVNILKEFNIPYEVGIISAHRTPQRMYDYARGAVEKGLKCIIAGAGGAAHLPGMVASLTLLPVFGVPIESRVLRGKDSLLSMVQMPAGIPVGTLAIGEAGAQNAALLAISVLGAFDKGIQCQLEQWRLKQSSKISWDLQEEKEE